jgi:NAD(P)-dependent dehydrogenase (short-subunit alcohol dehydrogenase family)
MGLNGQVAFVTGGSRGIGRAIALTLAEAGASVAVNYLTSEDRAIEVLGRPAILCQGDVSEYSAVLAKELAAKGITVNAVAPGFIETDMVAAMSQTVRERVLAQIPRRQFGRPEEVARAVLFLVSRDARYVTGQEISINGGLFV